MTARPCGPSSRGIDADVARTSPVPHDAARQTGGTVPARLAAAASRRPRLAVTRSVVHSARRPVERDQARPLSQVCTSGRIRWQRHLVDQLEKAMTRRALLMSEARSAHEDLLARPARLPPYPSSRHHVRAMLSGGMLDTSRSKRRGPGCDHQLQRSHASRFGISASAPGGSDGRKRPRPPLRGWSRNGLLPGLMPRSSMDTDCRRRQRAATVWSQSPPPLKPSLSNH